MCNRKHLDDISCIVPRKKKGIGYKLFHSLGPLRSLVYLSEYVSTGDKIEFIKKDFLYVDDDEGFCFFFSKKEAERASQAWDLAKPVLAKIEYFNCIARQNEPKFLLGQTFVIGLCRSFSVLST